MDCIIPSPDVQELSLVDSLRGEWIKLPHAVMVDVGPASQTLGGLLKITNRETFTPVAAVAEAARLPLITVKRHMQTLVARDWVQNLGRGKTRGGKTRRTSTRRLTAKTRNALKKYAPLPWWACCSIENVGRLSWATKAVLAVVMAEIAKFESVVEQQDCEPEELLEKRPDWFTFSRKSLREKTGLDFKSITGAKRTLTGLGIIQWTGGARDGLEPRSDFRVRVEAAGPGRCYISFGSNQNITREK